MKPILLEAKEEYDQALDNDTFEDQEGEEEGSGDKRKEAMQKRITALFDKAERMRARLDSKEPLSQEEIEGLTENPENILEIDRTADVIEFTGWSGAEIENKDTDKSSIELTEIDISKLKLDTSWLGGESILNGEKRLEALKKSGKIRLDAQILIALTKLPKEELNRKMEILAEANEISLEDLKKKYIFFDGTIIRDSGGNRGALCLGWDGSEWHWNYDSLDNDWNDSNPSLVLAS
jgi:hypothetical protein